MESHEKSQKQVMESLFRCLPKAWRGNRSLSSVDAVFYCEGPGSTLGLRIAAALTRTIQWGPTIPTPLYQIQRPGFGPNHLQEQNPPYKLLTAWASDWFATGGQAIGEKKVLRRKMLLEFPQSHHLLTRESIFNFRGRIDYRV